MESMNIQVHRIKMPDYEQHHYDKELLRQSGEFRYQPLCPISFLMSLFSYFLFVQWIGGHLNVFCCCD